MNIPDYYRILQVHEEAEVEVIEAAYRRLMRKYHPDLLPPQERDSDQVMARVQALNEAYQVLRDDEQRLAYDTDRATSAIDPYYAGRAVEPVSILTRCAATADEFKIYLEHDEHSGLFYVSDYVWLQGPAEDWEGMEPLDPFTGQGLIPYEESDPAGVVQFSHIEWSGFVCPSCQGMLRQPSGKLGTWVRCSGCGHIRCAGGTFTHDGFVFSGCPWCGKHNRITRQVATGAPVNMPVVGRVDGRTRQPRLGRTYRLPSGRRG
ncbi:MAG: DnaJ domain-containing protein [Anaerolineales bacterium]|nr:DnaJ domain-containing protein [Anaerolineales bacterium]